MSLAAVFLLVTIEGSGAVRSASGPPILTIRVVNSSAVEVKTLAKAERLAGDILGKAGIDVVWLDCSRDPANSCAEDRGPADLWIHVLRQTPPHLRGDATGFAVLTPLWKQGESYAVVALPQVEAMARTLDAEVVPVLGATLAHEIGHLLSGADAHSPAGVMRAHFGRQELLLLLRGELRFTSEQALRMRAEVARRMGR